MVCYAYLEINTNIYLENAGIGLIYDARYIKLSSVLFWAQNSLAQAQIQKSWFREKNIIAKYTLFLQHHQNATKINNTTTKDRLNS